MKVSQLLYKTGQTWLLSKTKKITLIGMSGLGKTFISNMLSTRYDWLHYSVDYRIGSDYMRDAILVPDKESNRTAEVDFTIDNLSPLSKYLGKPGNPKFNGIKFSEYLKRQKEHKTAEIASMLDIPKFMNKHLKPPKTNFVCDTSGSLCEIVDPENPNDPILSSIAKQTLIVLIKENDTLMEDLKDRFRKAPKPMYYKEEFLKEIWKEFCNQKSITGENVNPDDFSLYGFEKLIAHRRPLYNLIASNWGIEVPATEINKVKSDSDLNELICEQLPKSEK